MYRSFSNRVFGGVCGGMGAAWRINPWVLRILFILLTPLSLGTAALLYIALWISLPQESVLRNQRAGALSLLAVIVLTAGFLVLWLGRDADWLRGPGGEALFLPVLLLAFSMVILVRQVRN